MISSSLPTVFEKCDKFNLKHTGSGLVEATKQIARDAQRVKKSIR